MAVRRRRSVKLSPSGGGISGRWRVDPPRTRAGRSRRLDRTNCRCCPRFQRWRRSRQVPGGEHGHWSSRPAHRIPPLSAAPTGWRRGPVHRGTPCHPGARGANRPPPARLRCPRAVVVGPPNAWVPLHRRSFVGLEFVRLVQNPIRNTELANIVHRHPSSSSSRSMRLSSGSSSLAARKAKSYSSPTPTRLVPK